MSVDKELKFISGDFLDGNFPKDKKYLVKYFKSKIQKTFIRYYYLFGDYKQFVEHTGYRCSDYWLTQLVEKLEKLEAIKAEAKKNMDSELITKIETGKYKFK